MGKKRKEIREENRRQTLKEKGIPADKLNKDDSRQGVHGTGKYGDHAE